MITTLVQKSAMWTDVEKKEKILKIIKILA